MSTGTDLTRLNKAKTDIIAAIEEQGVAVPAGTKIDGMAPLILEIEGSGAGAMLTVNALSGSTITVTNGEESYTQTGGTAVFEGLTTGTWTVTASNYGASRSVTVDVQTEYSVDIPSLAPIYGYRHYTANSSPALVRLDDALGLSATAGVGTTAGSSDFDTEDIYSGIRLCNLAANGTVNAYEGDAGFTRNGTNGDVMVEIPQFWYKRVQGSDATGAYIDTWVSSGNADGTYEIHPAFTPDPSSSALSHIYVSAYETTSGYASKTSSSPIVGASLASSRTGIAQKGAGWSNLDIATISAVNMLLYTEFATLDAQTAIGKGYTDANDSTGYNCAKTGETDSMAGHTGRAAGTNGRTSIKWRGIENWWGNAIVFVDGLLINNLAYYYCLNPEHYASELTGNYVAAGFSAPSGASVSYITAHGYSANCPWLMMPTAISGGSASTYFCDAVSTNADGLRIARFGMTNTSGFACGPSGWMNSSVPSTTDTDGRIGCRLVYRPQ